MIAALRISVEDFVAQVDAVMADAAAEPSGTGFVARHANFPGVSARDEWSPGDALAKLRPKIEKAIRKEAR